MRALIALVVLAAACGPAQKGTGDDDDDTPDAGTQPHADAGDPGSCAATNVTAQNGYAPVDIIWAVDTSGSMDEERDMVQGKLNDFSTFIENAGIDHHVILLADPAEMTVPPPLGGGPNFLHVPQPIESHDAFQRIIERYPDYQAFLRPDALVHIVVVTDDESDMSEAGFESALAALTNPGISSDFRFHSICSEEETGTISVPPLPPVPYTGPCMNGLGGTGADGVGQIYMDTVAAHDGVWASICETNWDPVFAQLAQAAATSVELPCTFLLPDPPDNQTLDPNQVNFVFTPSTGPDVIVPRVNGAGDCGSGQGWYYDDPAHPTQIMTCPATCQMLEADSEGSVDIAFGCATVVP
ncbi:MAG TPA: hypothetical protein VL172_10455 [Kofleriaceae bacterium]|nr:hypothetical protein [Kofleriaceae bacterium]